MKKLIKIWDKLEESVLIFLIGIMGSVLFMQIIMRFTFDNPLPWPEAFGRYCQIWITFLGIGYGIRKDTHVGMTLLSERLNFVAKRIVKIICDGTGIFVAVVLFLASLKFITFQDVLSTAMQVPMNIVYMVIPVSAVLAILYYLILIVKAVKEIVTEEVIDSIEKEGQK